RKMQQTIVNSHGIRPPHLETSFSGFSTCINRKHWADYSVLAHSQANPDKAIHPRRRGESEGTPDMPGRRAPGRARRRVVSDGGVVAPPVTGCEAGLTFSASA